MKKLGHSVYEAYSFIFDSSRNPLRHIPDTTSRMLIMTMLAYMWSGVVAVYVGSLVFFGISVAAHILLILMSFFTLAIFDDAEKNQDIRLHELRNQRDTEKHTDSGYPPRS